MTGSVGVPADDRGLAYGDGLFETLRITTDGRVPLAEWHHARMALGARRLGIPFDEVHWWRALDALREQGAGVGKLLLTRGSGGRGYAPPARPQPRLLSRHHPLSQRPARQYDPGLVTGIAPIRLADQPALAGIKHANRLEQVLARREAERQGWDEALVCDAAGRPGCLTSMNLFAVVDGELRTPPVDRCGVAGVLRSWLLEQGDRPVRIRPLTLAALGRADEVFATNAVAGVLPVATLGVWRWSPGPVTRALMDATEKLFAS
jgi:4-amino-4-deoxychorismate lyase